MGPAPALTVPTPHFPVVGDNIPVAFFFTLHIAVAEYTAGAITMGPIVEAWGVSRGDPRALRYAERVVTSYYLLFSLGATLAVFGVVLLIGLWGGQFGALANAFLPLFGVIFGLFLVLAPLIVVYRNTFGRMSPRWHVALGVVVALLQNAFIVGITVVDTYLMTPRGTGLLGGFSAPPYIPLLVHRIVGNVSWAALLLAAYAVWRLGRSQDEGERLFHAWAARLTLRLGLGLALVMPVDGFALVEVLRNSQPGFFVNLVEGSAAYLFVVQEVLFACVVVGGNLALALEMPGSGTGTVVGRWAVGLSALGMLIGLLPAQVIVPGVLALRYVGIGLAVAVTAGHLAYRSIPERTMPRLAVAPGASLVLPFSGSTTARRAVVVTGVCAMITALWMGYMKEEARGGYAVYGELTQDQAHGQFAPGGQYYP
jgi:hypothetical protein